MASSLGGIRAIGPDVLDRAADEAWFGSDARRVHAAMSDRHAVHRPQVHPVFSLIAVGPVYILRHFSRLSPYRATATLVAGIAGLWAAALYALLRALGCRRTDAIAFTLLGITTAAGVFWLPLRETYALGSLGVLAALSLMADSPRWRSPTWLWIVASAATLAVTVTNWMFGLLGAALLLPIRRALRVTLGAFMLVVGLWSVQRALVPAARFFIAGAEERGYMYRPSWTRFAQVLTTLTIHSIVAPRVLRLAEGGHPRGIDNGLRLPQANQLTVQTAAIGSGGMWGAGATVAWLAMLGLGVRAAMRRSRSERIWLVLLLGLTGLLFALDASARRRRCRRNLDSGPASRDDTGRHRHGRWGREQCRPVPPRRPPLRSRAPSGPTRDTREAPGSLAPGCRARRSRDTGNPRAIEELP
jgi:hypothetical protein